MASTTSLAVSLAIVIVCMNIGVTMVVSSGFAAEMGVENVDLGLSNDIAAAADAVDSDEFEPVAIGSAFAGFTINGVKALVKVFALLSIGIPAILYTMGAPAWVWAPLVPLFVLIQGLGIAGIFFGETV